MSEKPKSTAKFACGGRVRPASDDPQIDYTVVCVGPWKPLPDEPRWYGLRPDSDDERSGHTRSWCDAFESDLIAA